MIVGFNGYFEAIAAGFISAIWFADAIQLPLGQLLDWLVR